ncbi:MAG TPA: inositol monophosphatase, partial [Hyphomonas sp.]|nr:inositol monophosphatase [Hyphomonas sp.]
GIVLVREAGGTVAEIDGGDFMKTGSVLAANEELHPLIEQQLRHAAAFARKAD